tara:strand:+ start:3649 stop:5592 length:1944 start_codon:yes stop_codon:yes gene_type:complete
MSIVNIIKNINKNPFEEISILSVKKLEEIILFAANKYYNSEDSIVSDAIYDIMIEFLQKKAPKSTVLKNIGSSVKNSKNRVSLDYHLGSMDKIKPKNKALNNWIKKYHSPYYLSDKLDGISALLTYTNDNKIKLNTRGTSTEGLDISGLVKYLDLPDKDTINKLILKIGRGKKNKLALRGELIMKQSVFKKNWSKTKKNVRNTIAGLINSKNFDPILAKNTELVIYEIVDPFLDFNSAMKKIKHDFITVNYKKFDNINDNILSTYFKERKEKGEYDVDGIIVTNSEKHKRNTNGNPKYAFAFKDILENMIKTSKVIKVIWKISKDCKIIPKVEIEPVEFGGVVVTFVTAHNADFVKKNKIGKGAVIKLTRSGEVIPHILEVIKKAKNPDMPDYEYKWNKTGKDIIVIGESSTVELRNLQYFFSTIDAKGFGPANVKKLFEAEFNTVKKVMEMKIEDYLILDGVKQKMAEKFKKNLEIALTNIKLETLMSASNIFGSGFGKRRILAILKVYPNILKIYKKWKKNIFIEKIMEIEGFNTITATRFVKNFKNYTKFHKSISKFIKSFYKLTKKTEKTIDLTVVMSGFRDKELEEKLLELGGKVSNSVSKNTNYLIVTDITSSSSKIDKASKLNVKIISRQNFNKILTNYS